MCGTYREKFLTSPTVAAPFSGDRKMTFIAKYAPIDNDIPTAGYAFNNDDFNLNQ